MKKDNQPEQKTFSPEDVMSGGSARSASKLLSVNVIQLPILEAYSWFLAFDWLLKLSNKKTNFLQLLLVRLESLCQPALNFLQSSPQVGMILKHLSEMNKSAHDYDTGLNCNWAIEDSRGHNCSMFCECVRERPPTTMGLA